MRPFVNPANLVSSAGLAAGFVALVLAADRRLYLAGAAVVAAALLDAVDGFLARRLSQEGRFGCHLDSLSDLVAFGVAPALMLHLAVGDSVPVAVGATVGAGFVLAGAWRLARFQLAPCAHRLEGLPIPIAGVALVVVLLALPAAPALVIALALAALMVSSVPVPTMSELGRRGRSRREDRSTVEEPAAAGAHPGSRRSRWRHVARRGGRSSRAPAGRATRKRGPR